LNSLCTNNLEFFQSHALGHKDESTVLALVIECSLLGCLGKFSLKWIFLPAVPSLFSLMCPLALRHGSPLPGLVKRDCMGLMLPALWAVSCDLFWNVHLNHYQLCIKKTRVHLYFFAISTDHSSDHKSMQRHSSVMLRLNSRRIAILEQQW
jgi:hypothetical protein